MWCVYFLCVASRHSLILQGSHAAEPVRIYSLCLYTYCLCWCRGISPGMPSSHTGRSEITVRDNSLTGYLPSLLIQLEMPKWLCMNSPHYKSPSPECWYRFNNMLKRMHCRLSRSEWNYLGPAEAKVVQCMQLLLVRQCPDCTVLICISDSLPL